VGAVLRHAVLCCARCAVLSCVVLLHALPCPALLLAFPAPPRPTPAFALCPCPPAGCHADEDGEEGGEDPRRAEFTQHCAELIESVMHHMPLDGVADQFAVQFLQQRMPPPPRKVGLWACRCSWNGEPKAVCAPACFPRASAGCPWLFCPLQLP